MTIVANRKSPGSRWSEEHWTVLGLKPGATAANKLTTQTQNWELGSGLSGSCDIITSLAGLWSRLYRVISGPWPLGNQRHGEGGQDPFTYSDIPSWEANVYLVRLLLSFLFIAFNLLLSLWIKWSILDVVCLTVGLFPFYKREFKIVKHFWSSRHWPHIFNFFLCTE